MILTFLIQPPPPPRQSIDSLLKIPDINVNARNFHDIPNEVMINTTDTTAADITSKSDARFWSIDAKNCPEGCRLHQGETALMLATMYGNKDAVEALVHYSKGVYEKKIKAIKMLLEVAGDAGTSSSNGDHSDTTDSKYNQVLVRDIDVLIESSLLSSFGNTRLLDSKIRLAGIDLVQRQEDHADQQQLFISVKESDWSRIQKSLSTSFVEMNIPTLNFNSHMDPKLNDLGTTPLLMAANGCDKEIVTILLAHGADSSVHIDHGDGGYSSIIDLIRDRQLNAINLDTKAKCGETETAIHTAFQTNPNNVFLATELGFKDTLKMLVKDNGNDVNFIAGSSSFYKGYSPLMLAVVSNNTEMVKFLVWGLNAIVDVANDNHDTALMVAIEKNMTGMVKLLVQRMGASVDAGKVLYTALYRKGLSDQIMNTLLDRKPRVSAVDYDNIVEMKIEEESATNEGDDHWVLLPSKSTAMALKYGLECELGLDGLSKLTSDEIRSMLEIKLKTAEGGFDAAFVKEVVINSGVF